MFNEDFLIKAAATLLGMPPQQAREHFAKLQQWNVDAITGFDLRIKRLESNQSEIIRLLSIIAAKLGVEENGQHEHATGNEHANVVAIADERAERVAIGQ